MDPAQVTKLSESSPAIGVGVPDPGNPDLGFYPYTLRKEQKFVGLQVRGRITLLMMSPFPRGRRFVIEPGTSVYLTRTKRLRLTDSRIVGTPQGGYSSAEPGAPFVRTQLVMVHFRMHHRSPRGLKSSLDGS